jgi:hypothetical protein
MDEFGHGPDMNGGMSVDGVPPVSSGTGAQMGNGVAGTSFGGAMVGWEVEFKTIAALRKGGLMI